MRSRLAARKAAGHAHLAALFDLSGRAAVVTGGAGALGHVVSIALAEAGASVAVVDLRLDAADQTAAAITSGGGQAFARAVDVSTLDGVNEVFAFVDREFGRLDILVNAVAAPVERFQAEDFPLDAWERMQASSLTSYFLCSQAAARRMLTSGRGGSIVNFGSIAGSSALGRGNLAYAVAKAGIAQLTRETAYAWAPHRIRVNAVLPCQFTNAAWADVVADPSRRALVDRVLAGIPLGRMGHPEEIVGPVLFLASDASSMVTGALLPVDGGNLAMNAGASQEW